MQLLLRREDDLVASVKSPSDAVELKVGGFNLTGAVQMEVVEALDLVLPGTDASEHPLPDDLIGANDTDVECGNTLDSRGACFASDILLFVGKGDTAKLSSY